MENVFVLEAKWWRLVQEKMGRWDWGTVLTLYQRFKDGLQSYLSVPPTHHQSWEVCRGRRRARRTKAVPSPTSPLLHNTPKAGNSLQLDYSGMPSYSSVISASQCHPAFSFFLTWRHYRWVYSVSNAMWCVQRPLLDFFHVNFKDLKSFFKTTYMATSYISGWQWQRTS